MQVFIINLVNKTITIEIKDNDSIEVLKEKIEDKEGIPKDSMRLLCAGKPLHDSYTLKDYNIRRESSIYIRPKF